MLFACAILAMSGPWASYQATSDVAEPWLTSLGLSREVAELVHKVLRKLGHFAAYGAFAWVAFRGFRGDGPASPRHAARAWTLALALAVTDESLQWLSSLRGASAWDILLDGAGAAAVLAVAVGRIARSRRAEATAGETSPGG